MKLKITCTALALLLGINFATAAARKPHSQIKNRPDVYSTKPDLPADVPYTNTRNHDWLGGYISGDGNEATNSDETQSDGYNTSPQRRRDWRERRRWRR